MPYIDIDLADFDTDDLIEELRCRNDSNAIVNRSQLERLYETYMHRRQDFEREFANVCYESLGKVIP